MRATGNRVGLSLGSSNLSLGATYEHPLSQIYKGKYVIRIFSRRSVSLNFLQDRRWWLAFFGVGLLMNGLAIVNSDLGLDVHVRLNVVNDDSNAGSDYPWGPTRWSDSDVQEPVSSGEYEGYIGPWYASVIAIQITSFVSLVMLSLLAGYIPSWRRDVESIPFDPMWSALVAWSPCLMFATGRGYDEAILALILALSVGWLCFVDGSKTRHLRFGILMMATSVMCILGWKGFAPPTALLVWLGVLLVGNLWLFIDERFSKTADIPITQRPWLMSSGMFCLTLAAITFVGWLGYGGTFSIVEDYPLVFLLSIPFAFIDGIGLFLLVGFCLWPFVTSRFKFPSPTGRQITMVACFISILGAGMVAYIGALWTLESQLWNISLFQCMILLGNNGRYATILVLPVIMLLHLSQPVAIESKPSNIETVPSQSMFIALLLLLPIVMFTGLHGQQLWQDDAGFALADVLDGDGQSFLLVAEESLAMHSLYVLKTNVDLDGTANIDGHWRSPGLAEAFLNSSNVDALLLAPGVDHPIDESLWILHTEQVTPFSLSSGSSNDEWRLYIPV